MEPRWDEAGRTRPRRRIEGVTTALFPADAAKNKARAEEQAVSRQYAGIHWDFDAKSIDMGRAVAKKVVEAQGLEVG